MRSAAIDGEAVVLDDQGRSNFAELQADLTRHGSPRAALGGIVPAGGADLFKLACEHELEGIVSKRPT